MATLLTLCLTACGHPDPPPETTARRLISMSPVITQTLIELGLADEIVAVGDLDPLAPEKTTSVGRYTDVDLERLITLRPTLVLTTPGAAGLPAGLQRLADEGRFTLADFGYPDEVTEVATLIRTVGEAVGEADAAAALALEMLERLGTLANRTANRPRPRVLLVFATGPVVASGPGTVLDELLAIAGGVNAAADLAVTAPVLDREALLALRVDVVFLLDPGGPALQDDDPRLSAFDAMQPIAVFVLNDKAVLIPGPSLADTAEAMAAVLHPDRSPSGSRDASRPGPTPGTRRVPAMKAMATRSGWHEVPRWVPLRRISVTNERAARSHP